MYQTQPNPPLINALYNSLVAIGHQYVASGHIGRQAYDVMTRLFQPGVSAECDRNVLRMQGEFEHYARSTPGAIVNGGGYTEQTIAMFLSNWMLPTASTICQQMNIPLHGHPQQHMPQPVGVGMIPSNTGPAVGFINPSNAPQTVQPQPHQPAPPPPQPPVAAPQQAATPAQPTGGQTVGKRKTPLSLIPVDNRSEHDFMNAPVPGAPHNSMVGRCYDLYEHMRFTYNKNTDIYFDVAMGNIDEIEASDEDALRSFTSSMPSSMINQAFVAHLAYNHVERIAVPMKSFLEARDVIWGAINDPSIAGIDIAFSERIWRAAIKVVGMLPRGPSIALDRYLTAAVNRALWVSMRNSSATNASIVIEELADLVDVVGPAAALNLPRTINGGKGLLARIVDVAIVNALGGNTGVMFTSPETTPLEEIRTSRAFPSCIKGVYPSKLFIPDIIDGDYVEKFIQRMQDGPGKEYTYLLSRRKIIVTNSLDEDMAYGAPVHPTTFVGITPRVIGKFKQNFVLPHDGMPLEFYLRDYRINLPMDEKKADRRHILSTYYDGTQEEIDVLNITYNKLTVKRVLKKDELVRDSVVFSLPFGAGNGAQYTKLDLFCMQDDNESAGITHFAAHR
jgi:hypothetical protein